MKMLSYSVDISAPADRVSSIMLGKDTFRQWAGELKPGIFYEGVWNKGSRIRFVYLNSEGKKEGRVAEIADYIPHRLVAIRHRGIVADGKEIVREADAASGAESLENYTFNEHGGITTLVVNIDTAENDVDRFNEIWPKALAVLKSLVESR